MLLCQKPALGLCLKRLVQNLNASKMLKPIRLFICPIDCNRYATAVNRPLWHNHVTVCHNLSHYYLAASSFCSLFPSVLSASSGANVALKSV